MRRAQGSTAGAVKGGSGIPHFFRKGISEKDYRRVVAGYRHQGGIQESLAAFLPMLAADKVFGKRRTRNAVWKYVNGPALYADTALGNVARKTPLVGKHLFTVKEKVPWGKNTFKEIERSSALGPLVKVRKVVQPIAVGVGLEKGVKNVREAISAAKERDQMNSDQELREKVASTMLRLDSEVKGHTKRAHALRLLYKQAELGVGHVPQSYGELEEKLASLLNQDLVVYEKALELAGGSIKLGELSSSDMKNLNALEQFQAAVLGDDA